MIEDENLVCECGCGENMRWSGHGRRPHYVNEAHKQRAWRQRKVEALRNDDSTVTKLPCPVCEASDGVSRRIWWFVHSCEKCNSAWSNRNMLRQGAEMAYKVRGQMNLAYINRPLRGEQ